MKKKAIVLLSAGLDSTVNLYLAAKKLDVVMTLTFNYGQKAADKEIESAKKLTTHYSVHHQVIDLQWFKSFHKSSLIVDEQKIPIGNQVQIDSLAMSEQTAKSVWVPNRNGIFLENVTVMLQFFSPHSISFV